MTILLQLPGPSGPDRLGSFDKVRAAVQPDIFLLCRPTYDYYY